MLLDGLKSGQHPDPADLCAVGVPAAEVRAAEAADVQLRALHPGLDHGRPRHRPPHALLVKARTDSRYFIL